MGTRGFVINDGVLEKYTGSAENVVIPDGVKVIWGVAFFRKDLKSVTLPDSVMEIGAGVFSMDSLTEINVAEGNEVFCAIDGVLYSKDKTKLVCFPHSKADCYKIPNGVVSIGERAFWCDIHLTEVCIPDSVREIGDEAFRDCKRIESISTPEGVTSIGKSAFSGCSSLRSVTLPESVKSIGDYAFSGCTGLSSITIPESVEHIGDNAFMYCKSLADENGFVVVRGMLYKYTGPGGDVEIPEGVTTIGDSAFESCRNCTSVTIPNSVTSIGKRAFAGCNFTHAVIPEGVTTIGENAFGGCSKLETLTIHEGVTEIGDMALAWCGSLKRVTIPDTVMAVGKDIFPHNATCLISICDPGRLPASLRSNAVICFAEDGGKTDDPHYESHCKYIKANVAKLINAAMEHSALLSLMCREKLIKPKDIDTYLAEAEKRGDTEKKAMLLNYQNSLGSKAVEKARAKKEKVKEDYADALANRTIARDPEKGIEGMTFVITGDLAKWESRKELQAYLEQYGAKLGSSVTKKTDYLVTNDTDSGSEKNRKARELGVPIITEEEFNLIVKKRYADAPQIVIPDWVKTIPERALENCVSLTSITIPDGIKSIKNVFYGCKNLRTIDIPESVTQMESAFCLCSSLTEVKIPAGVTALGYTFLECSSLKNLVIPAGVAEINGAFGGCSQLERIEIPVGVMEIGGFTFDGCAKLKMIIVPDGVKRIGMHAFRNCTDLEQIRIPASVKSIEGTSYGNAFDNCSKLTIHAPARSFAVKFAKEHNIPFVVE